MMPSRAVPGFLLILVLVLVGVAFLPMPVSANGDDHYGSVGTQMSNAASRSSYSLADVDLIVLQGEVLHVASAFEGSLLVTYVTILVTKVVNGPDSLAGTEVLLKHLGGEVNGTFVWISDQPYFAVGEIVEVTVRAEGNWYVAVSPKKTLQPPAGITVATAAGYVLKWYKPGTGWTVSTIRPGSDWYGPAKWPTCSFGYRINTANIPTDISVSFITYATASFQTWQDDPGSSLVFTYQGTGSGTPGTKDDVNTVGWGSIGGSTIAVTTIWGSYTIGDYNSLRITETDMEFDSSKSWSAQSSGVTGKYDVQNIGTHEAGHTFGLGDMYESADSEQTMYGYASTGETKKRTLEWGDIAGAAALCPVVSTVSGQVTGYYDVTGASPGATVSLMADVQNTGTVAFPSGVQVWFYVTGPSGAGSYVGSADASGLATGSTKAYSYGWTVPSSPATGSYSYKADIWLHSGASYKQIASFFLPARAFTVSSGLSGQVTGYYDVTGASPGVTVSLKADVQNTGTVAFPAGVEVWFYVTDPSGAGKYVGYAGANGLAAGSTQTYPYSWTVPSSPATGSYSYKADIWLHSGASYKQIASFFLPARAFTVSSGLSGQVTGYYDVTGASPGATVSLMADVHNTGTVAFPSGVQVWFYVTGPSGAGSYVGSADASGLATGSTKAYSYGWTVPSSTGSYSYKADIWLHSGASYKQIASFFLPARAFTVGYTIQLTAYYDVSNAHPGGTVTLSVDVKNTGSSALPSNGEVWFYVDGPGWQGSHWVGYASVAGLAAGATQTYWISWNIPTSAKVGTYTYWAQAWYSGPYRVGSDMLQPGRTFNVT